MTNDTTTLNGALSELGETMADNLVAMGVLDASANDGLTTLAGKILCIEPSIGGLDLDTAVTLSASSASIVRGQSVVLTSKLTATYDDETLVNVDLSGVLTGATILFKEGNTTLGSGVTDSNGIATATIYDLAVGSHTIKAVFAGTDNFNDCESSSVSVTVTAPAVDSITLVKSAGKDILSYADVSSGTEFCTLTATVLDDNDDPIPGETVVLKKNNVTWDTLTTDSNGQVSKTYTSSGVGDLEFVAQCGSILSETYTISDIWYAHLPEYTFAVSSGSAKGYPDPNMSISLPNNWELTFDAVLSNAHAVEFKSETNPTPTIIIWKDWDGSSYPYHSGYSFSRTTIVSKLNLSNVYHSFKITYQSGVLSFQADETSFGSATVSIDNSYSDFIIDLNAWGNGTSKIKNIKLKEL